MVEGKGWIERDRQRDRYGERETVSPWATRARPHGGTPMVGADCPACFCFLLAKTLRDGPGQKTTEHGVQGASPPNWARGVLFL